MTTDELPFSPAAERNKGPILEVLTRLVPANATVLEVASGTGQHAAHFAAAHAAWDWQPSDADPQAMPAIALRCAALPNVRVPLHLDVRAPPPGLGRFDAVVCANMLHIAPWAACAALMQLAAAHLNPGGALVLYGPFIEDGVPTSPGNQAFDADLRARNAQWGLRRMADVTREAKQVGLHLAQRFAMPANNLILCIREGSHEDAGPGCDVGQG